MIVAQPLQRQVEDWDDFVGQFESPAQRGRASARLWLCHRHRLQGRAGTWPRASCCSRSTPRPYQALYEQAKAQVGHAAATLADAKVELNRSQQLLGARATSQQDVDTRLATEHTAEADPARRPGGRTHRRAESGLHPGDLADRRPRVRRQGAARQSGDAGHHHPHPASSR
ncbi:MAG: hypothetical protein WDM85_03325 [Caulobacteraceae bacterium]